MPRIVSITDLFDNERARPQRDGSLQVSFTVKYEGGFAKTVTENSRERAERAREQYLKQQESQ